MEFDRLAAMAVCPCCGRETGDSTCPGCGYPDLYTPDAGERYALVAYREVKGGVKKEEAVQTARYLSRRCCLGEDVVARVMDTVYYTSSRYQWAGRAVLRRGIPAAAALWMAEHRPAEGLNLRIVEDDGEAEDVLLRKGEAMPLPPRAETPGEKKERRPLSFWEVAGAVALGNLIVLPVWLFVLALFF